MPQESCESLFSGSASGDIYNVPAPAVRRPLPPDSWQCLDVFRFTIWGVGETHWLLRLPKEYFFSGYYYHYYYYDDSFNTTISIFVVLNLLYTVYKAVWILLMPMRPYADWTWMVWWSRYDCLIVLSQKNLNICFRTCYVPGCCGFSAALQVQVMAFCQTPHSPKPPGQNSCIVDPFVDPCHPSG